jgi:thiosulfate/3-mercaptopyruvate sulfurtransferase
MGIGPGMQVVAYDDQGGSLAAVRLWWILRWLGHEAAAVLDGGWQNWLNDDLPVRSGRETRPPQTFSARRRDGLFFTSDQVERMRRDPHYRLIDVRAPERYRGEVEPIDPVAGHIPGALNAPYTDNLDPEGKFRSPEELRRVYRDLLGDTPTERVVFYCGSGVTSIHSILALHLAGLGEAKLYAGSWSEWIADRRRPVALGAEAG